MSDQATLVRIDVGLRPEHHSHAVKLYWTAFSQKLGPVLGPEHKALLFFKNIIEPKHALAAVGPKNQLLGLVGFVTKNGGLLDGSFADMRQVYGLWGAVWRAPMIALIERPFQERILQMDGICVAADARGQGIGTALLSALVDYARAQNLDCISLDVVDHNTKAQKLYVRFGFKVTKVQKLGVLRYLFKFKSSTQMRFHV